MKTKQEFGYIFFQMGSGLMHPSAEKDFNNNSLIRMLEVMSSQCSVPNMFTNLLSELNVAFYISFVTTQGVPLRIS